MSVVALRAPRGHGETLAVPGLAEAGAIRDANRRRLDRYDLLINGIDLAALRALARREAAAAARVWMTRHGLSLPSTSSERLIVNGHQPELFHPGVWIKNFAAHNLAQRLQLTPLNVIIDNDEAKRTAIAVPLCGDYQAEVQSVAIDRAVGGMVYEERDVRHEQSFDDFPDRVAQAIGSVPFQPILPRIWHHAVAARATTNNLGERIAIARAKWEAGWQRGNYEVPLSLLCRTVAFAHFAYHILNRLPEFHQQHNACLQRYRVAHSLRSRNHPVPDLAAEGEWREAPFWMWRRGEGRRMRPMFRAVGEDWQVRLGDQAIRVPRDANALAELAEQGWSLRTRAVTTTLFLRLLLADVFVHGIGGAIYDELTDELMRVFFALEPPRFLVLSATLRLPLARRDQASPQPRLLRHLLRDLDWNPDRHLGDGQSQPVRDGLAELATLRAEMPIDGPSRRARFERLRELNAALRPQVVGQISVMRQRLVGEEQALRDWQVANSREYAFVLFPEEELRPLADYGGSGVTPSSGR